MKTGHTLVSNSPSEVVLIGKARQLQRIDMQDEAVIVSQMSSKQVEVVVSKMDGSASRFPTREVVEREWGKDELRVVARGFAPFHHAPSTMHLAPRTVHTEQSTS